MERCKTAMEDYLPMWIIELFRQQCRFQFQNLEAVSIQREVFFGSADIVDEDVGLLLGFAIRPWDCLAWVVAEPVRLLVLMLFIWFQEYKRSAHISCCN